jgi:hypothetical protein
MKDNDNTLILSLVLGTAASLIAAAIAAFVQVSPIWVGLTLAVASILTVAHALTLRSKLKTLNQVGIKRWEPAISAGTNTQKCIHLSQRTLKFLGIASSKWLTDPSTLRQMLLRHAGSGGHADFLLLHPDSKACREFEAIKKRKVGSLGEVIKSNAANLLSLREEHFRINVRFYSDRPLFRLVIVDGVIMMIGLYSYVSEVGDDSPQLILDGSARPWSYYYAFNALFTHLWEQSIPAEVVLGSIESGKEK